MTEKHIFTYRRTLKVPDGDREGRTIILRMLADTTCAVGVIDAGNRKAEILRGIAGAAGVDADDPFLLDEAVSVAVFGDVVYPDSVPDSLATRARVRAVKVDGVLKVAMTRVRVQVWLRGSTVLARVSFRARRIGGGGRQ